MHLIMLLSELILLKDAEYFTSYTSIVLIYLLLWPPDGDIAFLYL